jgi:hypothetical protein
MGRERRCPDYDGVDVMSCPNGEDCFRGQQKFFGIAHGRVVCGLGSIHEKRAPMVSAATTLCCTDSRRIRSNSRARDSAAHALRHGPGSMAAAGMFGLWVMGDNVIRFSSDTPASQGDFPPSATDCPQRDEGARSNFPKNHP